ncbi:hypothetical protein [Sinorhizobium sp. BG8]|uniref:hypothetical protein n=1 Tax=Sinorhizobium sp. BG8 TaxID=2613773 RepID=UPI00193CA811|nr:hypothetical protein [Sinorhizobium sp. BG8]QRM53856.1 hypothetical protein F3Y30_04260 [Sinorhizobium sp. BG8]
MNVRAGMLALCLPFLLVQVNDLSAQNLIADVVSHEKEAVGQKCKAAEYAEDFVSLVDFNNDGLDDVITNLGAVRCDGEVGGLCGEVGCPYNFYIQVAEGGYFFAANADLYGYDVKKRYGNMVLELKANAASCGRDDSEYCSMTIRVRGARFETISKK